MALTAKFEALVRDLDQESLDELRRSVTSEINGRRRQEGFKVEDIHPHMTAKERERAAKEITRVLKELE